MSVTGGRNRDSIGIGIDKAKLRFASLVRVSTDAQEKQGESLIVQRKSIERDVDRLGGRVIEWYGGAESASGIEERKELIRLKEDALRATNKMSFSPGTGSM